jgi:hypothetical protein
MAPRKGAADANSVQAQSSKGRGLTRPKGKRRQVMPEPSSSEDSPDESPRPRKKRSRDAQPEIVHGDPDPEEPETVGAYQSGGNEGSGEACVHSVCCAQHLHANITADIGQFPYDDSRSETYQG